MKYLQSHTVLIQFYFVSVIDRRDILTFFFPYHVSVWFPVSYKKFLTNNVFLLDLLSLVLRLQTVTTRAIYARFTMYFLHEDVHLDWSLALRRQMSLCLRFSLLSRSYSGLAVSELVFCPITCSTSWSLWNITYTLSWRWSCRCSAHSNVVLSVISSLKPLLYAAIHITISIHIKWVWSTHPSKTLTFQGRCIDEGYYDNRRYKRLSRTFFQRIRKLAFQVLHLPHIIWCKMHQCGYLQLLGSFLVFEQQMFFSPLSKLISAAGLIFRQWVLVHWYLFGLNTTGLQQV